MEIKDRIRWQAEETIRRIVRTWPVRFGASRALGMGFKADSGIVPATSPATT